MTTETESKPVQFAAESGHWYSKDGIPAYTVENKSKPGTFRPTTLRDARKLGLLPSVTTITKLLHSESLVRWRINEAAHALMTSPRREGENEDAFIERVLWTEREHEEVAKAARDLGTDIHAAVEQALRGQPWNQELKAYVEPVLAECAKFGKAVQTERVVIGLGYGGKLDAIFWSEHGFVVVDFKTTKRLPKESYPEHRLQLAAYAAAGVMGILGDNSSIVRTCNIYISTTEPGKVAVSVHSADEWREAYHSGFVPLVQHWQWANDYLP
jgi:hypothetical protein